MDKTNTLSPKDFFLQVAILLCLYTSVGSLLALLFQVIDYTFPDQLQYYVDPYSGSIRFAIASLIIIFPIFVFLATLLQKEYERTPEKKDLWIRKWATYLNLFISGVTIAVSLITLLNSFLGGELTVRFALKALSAIVIAGIIFSYFISDIRKGNAFTRRSRSVYLGLGAFVVIVSVVLGFVTMGSPFNQRLRRFDDRRVQDLQSIQWQVINFWQQKSRLPQTLAELNDPFSGFIVPTDPEGKGYTYSVKAPLTFEVCADFSLPGGINLNGRGMPMPSSVYYEDQSSWQHESGVKCFERVIDPEFYPVRTIQK